MCVVCCLQTCYPPPLTAERVDISRGTERSGVRANVGTFRGTIDNSTIPRQKKLVMETARWITLRQPVTNLLDEVQPHHGLLTMRGATLGRGCCGHLGER